MWAHMKSMFKLKVGLLFHPMFTLFLCFYYMFDKYKKPSFYFPNYIGGIVFRCNEGSIIRKIET